MWWLCGYSLAVLISYVDFGYGQEISNNCELRETCGDCIQETGCAWCISPIGENGQQGHSKVHCVPRDSDKQKLCGPQETVNPTSTFQLIDEKPLSNEYDPVQISPQRIRIAVRKGEQYTVRFKYQQASNYPVDLYYIMDLSASMKDSKDRLGQLGQELASAMRKKTNNFQIGFGSFVDKVTLPYVNTYPDALESPCAGCAAPYSFKNHLSLTNSSMEFSQRVTRTQISGNLDTPEGGFDAMMQAIVCDDVIGWRPKSRHLLVFSTDAVSHIAGDGKLGGVVEPHDGQCHMEENEYKGYLTFDYPSVSHINHVAKQNNINIIFAIVTKSNNSNVVTHYRALSENIENSKMGTLTGNSNNVVKLISDIYDEIKDSVRVTSNATKDVNVKITSNCPSFNENGCSSVKPGTILDFKAVIQPLECLKGSSQRRYIKIKPEGLEESLIIELDVHCECSCASRKIANSTECSGQGDLECGICRCHEERFGSSCQCDRTESSTDDVSACIRPDGQNKICSEKGRCICGKCTCRERQNPNEQFYGKYCECDNFSCPLMCSGRGVCNCGKCECNSEWAGNACECPKSNRDCMAPGSNEICSGFGNCTCGQCTCIQDNDRHSGRFCEDCVSCPAQRCDEFAPCVECQVYRSGIYNETECEETCTIFKTIVDDNFKESQREDVKKCRVLDRDGCTINFEYSYEVNQVVIRSLASNQLITVRAANRKSCAEPPNILAWSLGVIGTVLLAGIIMLIIWKIVTTVHDRREYAKFENERNKLKWHRSDNPLYRGATTTFANPAYQRASQRVSVKNSQ
ncbi:integrin beta-PS-like [Cylas formicarius]|uniref:integrin beta-PS-like n=1 Tax=Cylas formicarius TaxID=197179 RepID=UPI00295864E9|nr:integrin beta-PS-like [Cylas formicarius]